MTSTTSTALSLRRDYLNGHRRMIVGRTVAATVAGSLPVPFLDDWLVGNLLGGAYRRIAAERQVDLDAAAITNLVHGRTAPAALESMAAAAISFRLAGKAWKRMIFAVTAARRARAAARTFLRITLFDHYCTRLHTGLGLDGDRALIVHDLIVRALDETPGSFSFEPFRRGALAAARATVKAPLELADIVTGGAVRRFLEKRNPVAEATAVSELESAIDQQLAASSSFLGRAVTAIELQLSAEVNPYLDSAIERFDRLWREREALT
ncbi:MAG: hypothetical protein K8W52_45075 [Deltaproteobacteria bacterium]|nr:hypothetical protein [Deltaproteobacteria bacterium]